MKLRVAMGALVTSTLLTAQLAWAGASAGTMTIRDFRLRAETNQVSMVFGAIALTDRLEIVCPVQITVGEWRAALAHREWDLDRPWVDVLLQLMDERGCAVEQKKADT